MLMDPFLKRLAAALAERHGHELDAVAVVLPGRRAGLYLQKYLGEVMGTTIWSPELFDVGGFMERMTGLRQGTGMELLFLLHQVHVRLMGDQAEPFGELLKWGPVSLRDMSEADAHLLDHDILYRDLKHYHEIEEWSFRLGERSPGQARLEVQWRRTGELHRALNALMSEQGIGTSGSIARAAVEGLTQGTIAPPWKSVWFAGLNALEPATTEVVKHLDRLGKATVAWDADRHYLSDPGHEAGRFLRRSIAVLGPGVLPPLEVILREERSFTSVAMPDALAQTRYAAQYLADLSMEERARTAVVLVDEHLLMPLLESLPPDIGPVNVTMGMPLEDLPVHSLTEGFLLLHAGCRADGSFRLADLERLVAHPFLHQGTATSSVIAALREAGLVHLSAQQVLMATASVPGCFDPLPILAPLQGHSAGIQGAFQALFTLASSLHPRDRSIQEQLFRMARLQRRLHHELGRSGLPAPDLRTYIELRRRLLRDERIGFFGEPLQGLQIMGFLETRAIDHDRVILLGAQEGSLPRTGPQQSWIPHDIRRTHHLPLPSDAEAVSAYHFYRLMHLAREVQVVSGGEGSAAGEPSRFMKQWMHEVAGKGANTGAAMASVPRHPTRNKPPLSVMKSPAVLERLTALAERGFSPSALGTYLRCPLDLWFQYGLRIRASDEVDGRLASDTLGDAVHRVLEDIHRPWVGSPMRSDDLRHVAREVHGMLRDRLMGQYSPGTLDHGHFRLRLDMAAKAMENFLLAEADRCARSETIIVALEEEVGGLVGPGIPLRGRCDRIERRNGVLHVLDMKTGSVEESHLQLHALEREALNARKQQALQLLVYACCYLLANPEVDSVRAGIVPLQRTSRSEGLLLKVAGDHDIGRDMLPGITGLLAGLVGEILDPARPFIHDPASTYCASCVT